MSKKILSLLLALIMVLAVCPVITLSAAEATANVSQSGTGAGTKDDPYLIGTADHLADWTANKATTHRYVKLIADINMAGKTWAEIPLWYGEFDGNGYAIYNLSVSRTAHVLDSKISTSTGKVVGGLFHGADGNLTVKDLALIGFNLTSTGNDSATMCGIILGRGADAGMAGGAFTYCFENVMIQGSASFPYARASAFVGYTAAKGDSSLKNCAFVGRMTAGSVYPVSGGSALAAQDVYTSGVSEASGANGWQAAYSSAKNVYSTGSITRKLVSENAKTFAETMSSAFKTYLGDRTTVTEEDFYGTDNKMGFDANAWYFYEDHAPIQKVFGATAEEALNRVNSEYHITTAAQLADTATWSGYSKVYLDANIDMSGVAYDSPYSFAGTFDGQGYAISNLYTEVMGFWHGASDNGDKFEDCGGFIDKLQAGGVIRNVAFLNMQVVATQPRDLTISEKAHCAMICATSDSSSLIENLMIVGDLTVTWTANNRMNTAVVTPYNGANTAKTNNIAFFGGIRGTMESAAYPSALCYQAILSNIYCVLDSDAKANSIPWSRGDAFDASSNLYVTGAKGASKITGFVSTTWAGISTGTIFDTIGADTALTKEHLYDGAALGFDADEWFFYDDCTPIQKVFAANVTAIQTAMAKSDFAAVSVWEIASAADLDLWAKNYNAGTKKDAKLVADIVYNDTTDAKWYEKDGLREWTPINTLTNTFDGNGHTITGLYLNETYDGSATTFTSFARNSSGGAVIKNVAFVDGYFEVTKAIAPTLSLTSDGNGGYTAAWAWSTDGHKSIAHLSGVVGKNVGLLTLDSVYADIDLCANSAVTNAEAFRVAGVLGYINSTLNVTNIQSVGVTSLNTFTKTTNASDLIGKSVTVDGTTTTLTKAMVDAITANESHSVTGGCADTHFGYGAFNAAAWVGSKVTATMNNALFLNNLRTNGTNASYQTQIGLAQVTSASVATAYTNVYLANAINVGTSFTGVEKGTLASLIGKIPAALTGFTAVAGGVPVLSAFASKVDTADVVSDLVFHNLGASVRTKEDSNGIRFSVEVNKNHLADAQYGLLIIPTAKLNGELTVNTAKALRVNVKTENILGADSEYVQKYLGLWDFGNQGSQMNVAMIGLPEAGLTMEYTVRAFAIVGEEVVYGDMMQRSPVNVAKAALANTNETQATKEAIRKMFGDLVA